jgi:hypothetical protein
MPSPRQTILATIALTLVALGVAIYAAWIAGEQRGQLRQLRERDEKLTAELHEVLRQNGERTRALTAAQAEFAALHPVTAGQTPTEEAIARETQDWLDRLHTLKRMFAEHPELSIPELAQLTDSEWLLAVKRAQLDTADQIRQSLAAVRSAAKSKFAQQMASALQKHLAATNGQLPSSPQALYAYFIRSIDPSFFQRYEMVETGNVHDVPAADGQRTVIREIAPVDEDYDARYGVTAQGMRAVAGDKARAWVDAPDGYDGMVRRAQLEFARANNGAKAAGLEQLAPYITPPLAPAKLQKLIDLEHVLKRLM